MVFVLFCGEMQAFCTDLNELLNAVRPEMQSTYKSIYLLDATDRLQPKKQVQLIFKACEPKAWTGEFGASV